MYALTHCRSNRAASEATRSGPGGRDSNTRASTDAGLPTDAATHLLFASRGYGRAAGMAKPTRSHSSDRFIWRPAVAEIVGEGRPWTALMISLLSMPCR
jgi:hypothetical protein